MKKLLMIGVFVCSLAVLGGLCFAGEGYHTMKKGWFGMGQKDNDAKGRYMSGMMMDKKLVATKDGGVAVLLGNKLIKYDAKLNLVKETEIKVDMKEYCPMMKKHKYEMEKK